MFSHLSVCVLIILAMMIKQKFLPLLPHHYDYFALVLFLDFSVSEHDKKFISLADLKRYKKIFER